MTRFAVVAEPVTALSGAGRGVELHPGRYEICEIDGAAANGVAYIKTDDGLVCVDPTDPNLAIEEN